MAAYTDTLGFYKGVAGFDAKLPFSISKLEVTLDFAKIIAARAAASATALAATDSLQALHIPAGCKILTAGVEVVTAETVNTTGTIDLGLTGGDVDAWCDGLAINALAVSTSGVENVGATQTAASLFAAADTLDVLLLTAAPTNAVIRVFAIVVDRN